MDGLGTIKEFIIIIITLQMLHNTLQVCCSRIAIIIIITIIITITNNKHTYK